MNPKQWCIELCSACLMGNSVFIDGVLDKFDRVSYTEESMNYCLEFGFIAACQYGNLYLARRMLDLGSTNIEEGIYVASNQGHLELIREFSLGEDIDWDEVLQQACIGDHENVVNFAIEHGASSWNFAIRFAGEEGNLSIIILILKHIQELLDQNDDDSLVDANEFCLMLALNIGCNYGDKNFVMDLIKMGASSWNQGLASACSGNNEELVRLMIDYGANDWNHALTHACMANNLELAEMMLDRGADNFDKAIDATEDEDIIELLVQRQLERERTVALSMVRKNLPFDIILNIKSCLWINGTRN